jgi:hypothetical protein
MLVSNGVVARVEGCIQVVWVINPPFQGWGRGILWQEIRIMRRGGYELCRKYQE